MGMLDIIAAKKAGKSHSQDEINFLIKGLLDGTIPDYQVSAWLMAVCFNGMSFDESYMLTKAMAESGDVLDLSEFGEYIIDKHSTGGVGDKVTLVLIPLLAAAGMPVAKFSGRGLGFTGGTIDKLESIPGFNSHLTNSEFIKQVKSISSAIAAQTERFTPADKKLYEIRDVTDTVKSIPLIASSVISKKIASGANVIILDVKCGQGAFMKNIDEAQELSNTMVEIGKRLNKSVTAVITSMEQPLGNTVGNGIEVFEAIQTLKDEGPEDLKEICLYLGAVSLVNAQKAKNIAEGEKILSRLLENGEALNRFKELVSTQGGDTGYIDNPEKLIDTKFAFEIKAEDSGYVNELNALQVAHASKALGTGREKKEDKIDHKAGIFLNKKIGDKVLKDDIIAKTYTDSVEKGQKAREILSKAYKITKEKVEKPKLILQTVE